MSTSGQSFQSRGFETSLDVARRQAYLTAPIAGQKRSSSEQAAEHSKVSKEVVWTVSHRSNHDADILEAIPLESARAALELPPNRFTASRIIPGPGATASESDLRRAHQSHLDQVKILCCGSRIPSTGFLTH